MASALGLPTDEITFEKIEAYNTMMKEGDKGKNLRAGTLPSKEREDFKAKVKALISKDPQYLALKALYEQLEKAYA